MTSPDLRSDLMEAGTTMELRYRCRLRCRYALSAWPRDSHSSRYCKAKRASVSEASSLQFKTASGCDDSIPCRLMKAWWCSNSSSEIEDSRLTKATCRSLCDPKAATDARSVKMHKDRHAVEETMIVDWLGAVGIIVDMNWAMKVSIAVLVDRCCRKKSKWKRSFCFMSWSASILDDDDDDWWLFLSRVKCVRVMWLAAWHQRAILVLLH